MADEFTIGMFSKITGLPAKTLRFYHEKEVLIPASVDPETGYRFYNTRDLERARMIVALKELGFPLAEISTILASCEEDGDLLAFLEHHKTRLTAEIENRQDLLNTLDFIIQTEQESRRIMSESPYAIEEKEIPEIRIAGMRIKGRYDECGAVFGTLGRKVGRHISGKAMNLYYDEEYKEEDADFEPCFPVRRDVEVEGVSCRVLPACRCVTLIHAGPYSGLKRTYEKLFGHIQEQGIKPGMPFREVYIKGPGMLFKGNPKKYLTEIQVPIEGQ